jgi:hypothetical protein
MDTLDELVTQLAHNAAEASVVTDPENWPLWLKVLLFPPMVAGAISGWLPIAKTPKWRAVQIGLIAYFFLFAIFFAWKSVIGYAIVALVALGLFFFLFIRWRNSN